MPIDKIRDAVSEVERVLKEVEEEEDVSLSPGPHPW
jgi:hypothetical protein